MVLNWLSLNASRTFSPSPVIRKVFGVSRTLAQREVLLERYRSGYLLHDLDAIDSLLTLGVVDAATMRPALTFKMTESSKHAPRAEALMARLEALEANRETPGRDSETSRSSALGSPADNGASNKAGTKAAELVQGLDKAQLQLFLACVLGRQFSYVRQYGEALEEAHVHSRYIPTLSKIARYGSAIWERAKTGNRVAVPAVVKIDPADHVDALEFWACFALQHIEEYVTLSPNPERRACVDTLDRILSNLEHLEDAFRSRLLRSSSDWLGPEKEEHVAAQRDLALLRNGLESASELQSQQLDVGAGLQFNDPRFPGGWAPVV